MDFMNLNQSAHGDREHGFIGARLRKAAQGRGRPLGGPGRASRGYRAGCAPRRPSPTDKSLKVARFGDNMREVAVTEGDKVEAQIKLGYSVNGYGVGDLVACPSQKVCEAEVDRPGAGVS